MSRAKGKNITRRSKDTYRLTYENMISLAFFKKIMPNLTFENTPMGHNHLSPPKGWKGALDVHGVVRLYPDEVWGESGPPKRLFQKLSDAIDRLNELKLPTWLIVCSEEAKSLFRTMTNIVCAGTKKGGYEDISDYAVIGVSRSGKGWIPHRDRDSLENAFDSDGFPNYITAWMPLTDASTDNSCLYFIPKDYDPTFRDEDKSHFTDALTEPESYQNIIAMPVEAGGMLSFASRTIHWGSRPLSWIEGHSREYIPRKAISLAIARKVFESPALARKDAAMAPTFLESVVLAASNALRYEKQHALTSSEKECFTRIVKENADLLNASYREQLFL